jgi:hypothetical protein
VDFKALIALAEKCEPTERSRTVIMAIVLKYHGVCSNRNVSSGLAFSLGISMKGRGEEEKKEKEKKSDGWGKGVEGFPLFSFMHKFKPRCMNPPQIKKKVA